MYFYREDLREHQDTIKEYAMKVEHATEFGTGTGGGTSALIEGGVKKLITYDPCAPSNLQDLQKLAEQRGILFQYIHGYSTDTTIEETDLLFIDSFHDYNTLSIELKTHTPKVKKYILLHDTQTFRDIGQDRVNPGLWPAIEEFLSENPNWKIEKHYTNNNGLTVLTKQL